MEKTITDQYHGDPTYAQLHVLTRSRPLARQIIKTASFHEKKAEVDSLPSSAFAWEDERRFPVHTREDTVASILYRSKVAYAVPEHVDEKLVSAAKIYKVQQHVFADTSTKTASAAPAIRFLTKTGAAIPGTNQPGAAPAGGGAAAPAPGAQPKPTAPAAGAQPQAPAPAAGAQPKPTLETQPQAQPAQQNNPGVTQAPTAPQAAQEQANNTHSLRINQQEVDEQYSPASIDTFEGGADALAAQGYFRNPNDPNEIYFNDEIGQGYMNQDPRAMSYMNSFSRYGAPGAWGDFNPTIETGDDGSWNDGETMWTPEPKTANYALPQDQRLPLGDAGQVKVAEHVLCRDFQKLRLEKRADAFSRLVEAAKEHDVELRPMALKMAGLTMSNTKTMRTWLEARAAASDGSVQQAFDKLASGLRKAPAYIQDRKTLVKLASTIEQLDTQAGLRKHYDRKLPDPLMTVFNTEKVATEMCDVAGTQVPCEELMALPPEIWEQVDAPEVAEVAQTGDTAMFKQVFDTLPLDIKVVLQSQLG